MGDTNLDLKLLSPLLKSRIDEKILPLQKLDISWCEDCDAESLIELIHLCPELKSFKSRACDYVTNDVVFELATTCSSLEHVNIARCNCVQDDSITLLAQNNSSTLNSLDIAWSKASDVSIKIVFGECKKLCISKYGRV